MRFWNSCKPSPKRKPLAIGSQTLRSMRRVHMRVFARSSGVHGFGCAHDDLAGLADGARSLRRPGLPVFRADEHVGAAPAGRLAAPRAR